MPKNPNVKKVLVIGSGPIVIGQAAEFDYAGTQACRSLKEEGVEVAVNCKRKARQHSAHVRRPGRLESGHGTGGKRLFKSP